MYIILLCNQFSDTRSDPKNFNAEIFSNLRYIGGYNNNGINVGVVHLEISSSAGVFDALTL